MSIKRKYECPFCNYRGAKDDLIIHVEDKHEELIPEGFTAGRVVFNKINNKTHGICVVCKKETKLNQDRLKYDRLCGNPKCKEKLRQIYSKNMIKIYGTDNILNDVEQQEKMLKNRKISGKYRFSDGGYHTYCGSYERKALEFLDKVMKYKSSEILSPGPTIDYIYKGKSHKFITDIMIIPYNLLIDVKDGGDNPNNREMPEYRAKQEEKEKAIIKMGEYNYLRLTNNNFHQLIYILSKLKLQMLDTSNEDKSKIVDIHEEVETLLEQCGLRRI